MAFFLSLMLLQHSKICIFHRQILDIQWQQSEAFAALEMLAAKLIFKEKNNEISSDCVTIEQNLLSILHTLRSKKTCMLSFDKKTYYYLIEDLGTYPCLEVQSERTHWNTVHYRLNILSLARFPQFLQLRFAKRGSHSSCKQETQSIREGILTWNYLAGEELSSLNDMT